MMLVLSFSNLVLGQSGRRLNQTPSVRQTQSSARSETFQETNVYKTSEVDTKAVIIDKPEPAYTPEAREKGVGGMIVLRLVLALLAK